MDFLLSIVIPTKNRQYYARQCVKQIYDVTDNSVQIVVHDNSDNNSLCRMLAEENYSRRVKYTYIPGVIRAVDNYAGGIADSDGDYICCIGDDDGVLRGITEIVKWAKENDIVAIKPGVQASYFWPGTMPSFIEGCLNLERTDSTHFFVSPKKELVTFLQSACNDLPNALLVKAYHGIVRKDMFENIYRKTGKYVGGLSTDIYLSVALSLNIDWLLCLNFPLTIFGACKSSTTGDSVNKVNVGKLEDTPHLKGMPYDWSDMVPRYYSGINIWADSAMHALDEMGASKFKRYFSIEKLSAECLLNHRMYKKEIMENFERNHCDKSILRKEIWNAYPGFVVKEIKHFWRNIKPVAKIYRNLRDKCKKSEDTNVFTIGGVKDIVTAERMISDVVQPEIIRFICKGVCCGSDLDGPEC